MSDTLKDLKDRDIDNLQYLLKNKQIHVFKTSALATIAVGEMLHAAVLRAGLDLTALMGLAETSDEAGEMVDEAMRGVGLRIETRPYTNEEDKWRSGIYVYKNNEILAFIGAVTGGAFGFTVETTEQRPETGRRIIR